jgi:hypothetical protein
MGGEGGRDATRGVLVAWREEEAAIVGGIEDVIRFGRHRGRF